jgi:hypothetical protein
MSDKVKTTTALSMSLKFRNSFVRKNEDDGSTYRIYCYLLDAGNDKLALAQYEADTKASGYNAIVDEESGLVLHKATKPIPQGCNIIRTSAGKWVADTQKWDELNALAGMFPNLGLGQALVSEMLKGVKTPKSSNVPAKDDNAGDAGDAEMQDPFSEE